MKIVNIKYLRRTIAWTLMLVLFLTALPMATVTGFAERNSARESVSAQLSAFPNKIGRFELINGVEGGTDYYLAYPRNYVEGKEYPLLILLHYAGGLVTEFLPQYINELDEVAADCFMIAPSIDYGDLSSQELINAQKERVYTEILNIKQNANYYHIDTNRFYLLGFSGGGILNFELNNKDPQMFAAFISVAGMLNPFISDDEINANFARFCVSAKGKPMKVIMGEKDEKLAEFGNKMERFAALNAAVNPENSSICEYIVYRDQDVCDFMENPNLNIHNCSFHYVLGQPDVFDWLFKQSKLAFDDVTYTLDDSESHITWTAKTDANDSSLRYNFDVYDGTKRLYSSGFNSSNSFTFTAPYSGEFHVQVTASIDRGVLLSGLSEIVAMNADTQTKKVIATVSGSNWNGTPDPTKVNVINYTVSGLNGNNVQLSGADTNHIQELVALKSTNPSLKIVLNVLAWNEYKTISESPNGRLAFANSCRDMVSSYHLDGVEISWVHPDTAADRENYVLLMQQMRTSVPQGKTVSMMSNVISDYWLQFYDLEVLNQYVDYFNLSAYNFAWGDPPNAGTGYHDANLYTCAKASWGGTCGNAAVQVHLRKSIPNEKIILGVEFGGYKWGSSSPNTYIFYKYSEIVAMLQSGTYTDNWDDTGKASYLTKNSNFEITYESAKAIGEKAAYVKAGDLGGMSYTNWSNDDSAHTLANAVWEGLSEQITPPNPSKPDKRVVAYLQPFNDERWRLPDPNIVTTINYSASSLERAVYPYVVYMDDVYAKPRLLELLELKRQNPDLELLLTINGGGDTNAWNGPEFRNMTLTKQDRTVFIQSCLDILTQYPELDGFDIDYEEPVTETEKQAFTDFIRELRAAIGWGKTLSIASGGSEYTVRGMDLSALAPYLDYFNVMTYCYSWGAPGAVEIGFHDNNLYNSGHAAWGGINADQVIREVYLNRGISSEKIVIGLQFPPIKMGYPDPGMYTYEDVKALIASGEYTDEWDDAAKASYLSKNGRFEFSYLSPRAISEFGQYTIDKNLGGMMYWDYFADDLEDTLSKKVWTALFGESSLESTITIIAGTGGAASGGGIYTAGDLVMIQAVPDAGYEFDGWYENGVKIKGATAVYIFGVTSNRTLEAKFKRYEFEFSGITITGTQSKRNRLTFTANIKGGSGMLTYAFYIYGDGKIYYENSNSSINTFSYASMSSRVCTIVAYCTDETGKNVSCTKTFTIT